MRPLTTSQVMDLLGVSRMKLRLLMKGGMLEYFTLPNTPNDPNPRRYVNPDVLLAYAKKHNFSKQTQDKIEALIPKES